MSRTDAALDIRFFLESSGSRHVRSRHTFLEQVEVEPITPRSTVGLRRSLSDSLLVDGAAACARSAYADELECFNDDVDSQSTTSTAAPDDLDDEDHSIVEVDED
mmetsp:Transcript_14933/g.32806  ORF Transcript_14933/g.32806 Transcript_14933/m.32806 type:complete len:105 (-) Transcript_14933:407-721(-)